MRTADDRANLVPLMQAYDERVHRELEAEQITHVDLTDYQPGAAHYEQLQAQMALANQYQWPSLYTENV